MKKIIVSFSFNISEKDYLKLKKNPEYIEMLNVEYKNKSMYPSMCNFKIKEKIV